MSSPEKGNLAHVRTSLVQAFGCLDKSTPKTGFCPLDDLKVLLTTTGEMKLTEDEVADLLGTCEIKNSMVNYHDLADAFVLRFEHVRTESQSGGTVVIEQGQR